MIQKWRPINSLQCTEDHIELTCLMSWLEFWLLETHNYKEYLVVWGNTNKQKQALYPGQMSFINHNKIFLVNLVWLHRLCYQWELAHIMNQFSILSGSVHGLHLYGGKDEELHKGANSLVQSHLILNVPDWSKTDIINGWCFFNRVELCNRILASESWCIQSVDWI